MILYFGNPSTPAIREAMVAGRLGAITTPDQGNVIPPGVPWVADNGCFGKGYPGDEAWLSWLAARPWDRALCHFATAPDVVGDAAGTLERSAPWLPKIRQLGYRAALVAQNGLEYLDVPWDEFDVLFLGGTAECPEHGAVRGVYHEPVRSRIYCPECDTQVFEWKIGPGAEKLATEAIRRGKTVHMGRVNGKGRLFRAAAMGCSSVDGTFLARGPATNLPQLDRWLAALKGLTGP